MNMEICKLLVTSLMILSLQSCGTESESKLSKKYLDCKVTQTKIKGSYLIILDYYNHKFYPLTSSATFYEEPTQSSAALLSPEYFLEVLVIDEDQFNGAVSELHYLLMGMRPGVRPYIHQLLINRKDLSVWNYAVTDEISLTDQVGTCELLSEAQYMSRMSAYENLVEDFNKKVFDEDPELEILQPTNNRVI